MYTQMALVNKTAVDKIREFEHLVAARPELLESVLFCTDKRVWESASGSINSLYG